MTGVRVTDVDKQRSVATWAALEVIMRGHPTRASSPTSTPEDAAKLTPQEIEMMRKYTEFQDKAKKYAKTKREQIAVAPGSTGIGIQQ